MSLPNDVHLLNQFFSQVEAEVLNVDVNDDDGWSFTKKKSITVLVSTKPFQAWFPIIL